MNYKIFDLDLEKEFSPVAYISDENSNKIKAVIYKNKDGSNRRVVKCSLWNDAPNTGIYNKSIEKTIYNMGLYHASQEEWELLGKYLYLKILAGKNKLDWQAICDDPRNDILLSWMRLIDKYAYKNPNFDISKEDEKK